MIWKTKSEMKQKDYNFFMKKKTVFIDKKSTKALLMRIS